MAEKPSALQSSPLVVRTAAPTAGAAAGAWDSSRRRYAAAYSNGIVEVWKAEEEGFSPWILQSRWQADNGGIHAVLWTPPQFGTKLAVCSPVNGVSVWAAPPVSEIANSPTWRLCARLPSRVSQTLALAMGPSPSGRLLLVAASGDGWLRVFEEDDILELKEWRIQAEVPFIQTAEMGSKRAICTQVALSWNPSPDPGQPPAFLLGSKGTATGSNTAQVWQQSEMFNKWKRVAFLGGSNEKMAINDVAWAQNAGRAYDALAVASGHQVLLWRLKYELGSDGLLNVEKMTTLNHDAEVRQVDWDMGGFRVAAVGADLVVRLWRVGLAGQWEEYAKIGGGERGA